MFRRSHLKILLIGNSGVGKSALMNQYVNNRFSSRYRATIGADFLSKDVHIDGRKLTVQIWDTAGTERFQALGTALYRGSDCCLLVFDVTSLSSFQALDKWHKQLLLQIEPEEEPTFPTAVIGNKMDLGNREVSSEEAEMWSKLHEAKYFETSAKEATNVQEMFEWAIRAVLKNLSSKRESFPTALGPPAQPLFFLFPVSGGSLKNRNQTRFTWRPGHQKGQPERSVAADQTNTDGKIPSA